jgi:hypothetical protein
LGHVAGLAIANHRAKTPDDRFVADRLELSGRAAALLPAISDIWFNSIQIYTDEFSKLAAW